MKGINICKTHGIVPDPLEIYKCQLLLACYFKVQPHVSLCSGYQSGLFTLFSFPSWVLVCVSTCVHVVCSMLDRMIQ